MLFSTIPSSPGPQETVGLSHAALWPSPWEEEEQEEEVEVPIALSVQPSLPPASPAPVPRRKPRLTLGFGGSGKPWG